MRQALNENPKVQAGVVVFLLLAGVLLFMKMSKKEEAVPAAGVPATSDRRRGRRGRHGHRRRSGAG